MQVIVYKVIIGFVFFISILMSIGIWLISKEEWRDYYVISKTVKKYQRPAILLGWALIMTGCAALGYTAPAVTKSAMYGVVAICAGIIIMTRYAEQLADIRPF